MKKLSEKELLEKEYLNAQELCTLSGTRYSTIKFYSEEGLLPFSQADTGLRRRYEPRVALKQLERIEKLKDQRKTIEEIKELLK